MSDVERDLTPRPPSESRTLMSVVMEIAHANNAGFVHGGTIMRLVDSCAGIAAQRHARTRVVTAAMDDMSFVEPVYIGDLVTVRAMVNDAHRTSMEVGVRVEAETIATGVRRHVNSAHLVFVALDDEGKPTPVAPIHAETDQEKRRQARAQTRRQQRLLRKAALEQTRHASRDAD